MKTLGLTVPIVIATLTFVAVWGVGMLAVKASATSTQISIDLLRQHLQVARIHDRLLLHSSQSLKEHLEDLSSEGVAPIGDAEVLVESPKESPLRPWPERAGGEAPGTPTYLEGGLAEARPLLERLLGRLDEATERP